MKKHLFTAVIAGLTFSSFSQIQIADFETPLNSADTAWFGQDQTTDGDTTFIDNGIEFSTNFNAAWGIYSGWAYSNSYDQTTPGPVNQFSSITGVGAENTAQFGVCNASGNAKAFTTPSPNIFSGAYFTNTTYAYLSMENGDSFGKKFGDSTDANGATDGTNGEDWFLLTVYGLNSDSSHTGDSVNFYLADYRFSDNTQDYITDTWEYVSLVDLGSVYGLDFKLSSSDVGNFGMNTPSYFAMDYLIAGSVSIEEQKLADFKVFPNPAGENVNIVLTESSQIAITDITGKMVYNIDGITGPNQLSLKHLKTGIYLVTVSKGGISKTQKLVKK